MEIKLNTQGDGEAPAAADASSLLDEVESEEDGLTLGIADKFAQATADDVDEFEDVSLEGDDPFSDEDLAADPFEDAAPPQADPIEGEDLFSAFDDAVPEKPAEVESAHRHRHSRKDKKSQQGQGVDAADLFEDEPQLAEGFQLVEVDDKPKRRRPSGYKYPVAAAVLAVALFATPAVGIAAVEAVHGDVSFDFGSLGQTTAGADDGSSSVSSVAFNTNQALPVDQKAGAEASNASVEAATEGSEDGADYPDSKTVKFAADGPGHIEPISNCEIDGTTGEIRFIDPTENASFRIVRDVEGASIEIKMGDEIVSGDVVVLKPLSDYGEISLKFVDEVALAAQMQAEEEARIAAEQQAAAQAAAAQQTATQSSQRQSQAYQSSQSSSSSASSAPDQTTTTTSAPAQTTTTTTTTTSSASINVPMTATEWETAWSVWNSYTAFRAQKGVPQVVWSDYCALLAYNTCVAESKIGTMQHKIAIPSDQQLTYSDILQYASWRKSGVSAVDRWANSEGHHRQMRNNNGTTEAGVGVYYDGSTWWYTIVYNFSGRNQYQGAL